MVFATGTTEIHVNVLYDLSAICVKAQSGIIYTVKAVKASKDTMAHLYAIGHSLGFSASPSSKSRITPVCLVPTRVSGTDASNGCSSVAVMTSVVYFTAHDN
jgi:hypothetical protein